MSTKNISAELRHYLADYYSRDQYTIDPIDDIRVDDSDCECVQVYGVMPNTNYIDWFDAGIIDGLQTAMERESICPHCHEINHDAFAVGAVDGPRKYHAACWQQVNG